MSSDVSVVLRECAGLLGGDPSASWRRLFVGVDIGTTNTTVVFLNEEGLPVAVSMVSSEDSVRDGVVLDYLGAVARVREALAEACERLGLDLELLGRVAVGASAYPPGVREASKRVCAHVLEACGLDCVALYEEPVAAAVALGVEDGLVVDVGGGTTGVALVEGGSMRWAFDEPTGGRHVTLVIAGRMGISFEEAEALKRDPGRQRSLFPAVRPVFERMAAIARDGALARGWSGEGPVLLTGGGVLFEGALGVFEEVLGRAEMAPYPLLMTALGIALSLFEGMVLCGGIPRDDMLAGR